jgi:hypothetical protein
VTFFSFSLPHSHVRPLSFSSFFPPPHATPLSHFSLSHFFLYPQQIERVIYAGMVREPELQKFTKKRRRIKW